jgi:hypothetical protein
MLSVVGLLGCELAVPDHTTPSRRAARLESITRGPLPRGPLHVLIDSTGLKVYGAGQWQTAKHGRSRRTWRKLHLGVDACSGQIVAVTLTDQDVSDESQVAALLEQVEQPIEQVTADGADDGEPTHQTIAAHDSAIAVVIPPQQNAVPSAGVETDSSPRDTHLLMIASLGRLGWQGVTGYGKRALVETARRTEAVVGAVVLNRMLDAARPNSVRRSVAPA